MRQQGLDGFEPAASAEYTIVFDGGSIGNPGHGYGSYQITGPGISPEPVRLDFASYGPRVTNNQAEYRSLIAALTNLSVELGTNASTATVIVRGDSLLVINQLLGTWKVKNLDLRPLREEAATLLRNFGRTKLIWHDRSNSLRVLGH